MSTASASLKKEGSSNRNRTNRRRRKGSGGGGGKQNYRGPQNQRGGKRRRRRRKPEPPKPKTVGEKISAFFKNLFGGEEKPKLGRQPQPANQRPKRNANRQAEKSRPKPKPSKKPTRAVEPVEITTERLYVGNLDYEVTEGDLYDLFSGAGKVQNAEVVCHRHTQRSKGYAFVEMSTIDEARRAAEKLHDQDFMGRKLAVTGAKSSGPKSGGAPAEKSHESSESADSSDSTDSSEEEAAA